MFDDEKPSQNQGDNRPIDSGPRVDWVEEGGKVPVRPQGDPRKLRD